MGSSSNGIKRPKSALPPVGTVYVKLWNGRTQPVLVTLGESLGWLKLLLYDWYGYDPTTCRIVKSTKTSQCAIYGNGYTLNDHGITFGMTLICLPSNALRGGTSREELEEKLHSTRSKLEEARRNGKSEKERRKAAEKELEEARKVIEALQQPLPPKDGTDVSRDILTTIADWRKEVEAQRREDRRQLEEQMTQMNKAVQDLRKEIANKVGQKRPAQPPAPNRNNQLQYAVVKADLDSRREKAQQSRTRINVQKYVEGLGVRGVLALGHHYRDTEGRFDVPQDIRGTYSQLQAKDETAWKPAVVMYLLDERIPLPSVADLQPTYNKLFGNSSDANDNLFRAPGGPLNYQPNQGVQAEAPLTLPQVRALLQRELRSALGATNGLSGRAQMMNPGAYHGPLDTSPLYGQTPGNQRRALQAVEDHLLGKSKTPFTIQSLRRGVIPGATAFDVKSSSHVSSALMGLLSTVARLQAEGKTVLEAERIQREITYANTLITQIPEGTNISACIEAWALDLSGKGCFCGGGYIYECKNIANVAKNSKTPSWQRKGGNYQGARCNVCKQQGHRKNNCPWTNGRPIPDSMICHDWNMGICRRRNDECDRMHICSLCKQASQWHPKTACFKTRQTQ